MKNNKKNLEALIDQTNTISILHDLERMKQESEILDHVERLYELRTIDGEPYFKLDWLLERYGLYTQKELQEGKRM